MSDRNPKKAWLGVIVGVVVVVASLLAGGTAAPQSAEPEEAVVPQVPILTAGGSVDRVAVLTETAANIYTPGGANPPPGTFVTLPGAVINTDVPPNSTRLFVVQFSAESACYSPGSVGGNFCQVRILIGGVEGNPVAGPDFAFDSTDLGDDTGASWESHAMQRSRRIGNTSAAFLPVQIVVQRTTTSTGTTLRLDDWHLTMFRVL